jgi:hypothetical protein
VVGKEQPPPARQPGTIILNKSVTARAARRRWHLGEGEEPQASSNEPGDGGVRS